MSLPMCIICLFNPNRQKDKTTRKVMSLTQGEGTHSILITGNVRYDVKQQLASFLC